MENPTASFPIFGSWVPKSFLVVKIEVMKTFPGGWGLAMEGTLSNQVPSCEIRLMKTEVVKKTDFSESRWVFSFNWNYIQFALSTVLTLRFKNRQSFFLPNWWRHELLIASGRFRSFFCNLWLHVNGLFGLAVIYLSGNCLNSSLRSAGVKPGFFAVSFFAHWEHTKKKKKKRIFNQHCVSFVFCMRWEIQKSFGSCRLYMIYRMESPKCEPIKLKYIFLEKLSRQVRLLNASQQLFGETPHNARFVWESDF